MTSKSPKLDPRLQYGGNPALEAVGANKWPRTWLSEARDPSMIGPGRILVVGDDDAIAMARVVDLVEHRTAGSFTWRSFLAPWPSTSRQPPAPRSSPPD